MICPQAKQTRLCFSNSSIKTSRPFQMIHCDIWGPFSLPSHSNSRFFLTIVDDFSHATWIYLMAIKSETSHILQSFFAMVHTQFNSQIKTIVSGVGDINEHFKIQVVQTNNGTEFLSKKHAAFFFI